MSRTDESIITLIREAFRDVSLGNGDGLRKAKSLDDYGEGYTKERIELDAKEKAEGWQSLNAKDLDENEVALSFFDPEGMRFHLPAYMIYHLDDAFHVADILFHLTDVNNDHARKQFSLLNQKQRNAVREYLLFIKDEMGENAFWCPGFEALETALEQYWTPE